MPEILKDPTIIQITVLVATLIVARIDKSDKVIDKIIWFLSKLKTKG